MVTETRTRQVHELIDAIEVRPTRQDLRDERTVNAFLNRLDGVVYTTPERQGEVIVSR